jgi:ribonuclease T1
MLRLRLCLLVALLWLPQAQATDQPARTEAAGQNSLPVIAVAELPAEAHDTLRAVKRGGPFSYDRDGVVFMNYERVLPRQTRGYYREYTVKTPGARDRGARRIVCGPLPEGNSGKDSERDEAQEVRSGATDTYHEGRRESEHRTTIRFPRAATLTEFPECYYTADHYQSFKRIREQP